jgi:hypothetical protein
MRVNEEMGLNQIRPPPQRTQEAFFSSQAGIDEAGEEMVHWWKTALEELTDGFLHLSSAEVQEAWDRSHFNLSIQY